MLAILATDEDIENVVKDLESCDVAISVLVNNVGGSPIVGLPFRPFSTYTFNDIERTVSMNALFMTKLTNVMIPLLCRRRGVSERSLVLSLTSAAHVRLPYLTMYSATKAYNLAISNAFGREFALHDETKHIDALAVMPGDVISQGNSAGVSKGSPACEIYGQWIVGTVDEAIRQGRRVVSPYWKHALDLAALEWIPDSILTPELSKWAIIKKDAFNERFEREGY